jgi:hypothetical protein
LESFQEKLGELDDAKKEEILKEKAVHAALLRAQGVKVKDDPKLLRKTLKRDIKKKEKSVKAWCVSGFGGWMSVDEGLVMQFCLG